MMEKLACLRRRNQPHLSGCLSTLTLLTMQTLVYTTPCSLQFSRGEKPALKPGNATLKIARIAGGKIIDLDLNEQRLRFCRERLKEDHIVNAFYQDVLQQLREITSGGMPRVVLDTTGNLKAINHTFQYMAHGGRYVLIGLQKGDISFSHPECHKREGSLFSSRNATRQDFEQVLASIQTGEVAPTS